MTLALDADWLFVTACPVGDREVAAEGAGLPVTEPATGAELARVPDMDGAATQQAIDAAAEAFPGWAGETAKTRAAALRRWAELIRSHTEDIARILTAEQGKPLKESRGELGLTANYAEWFGEEAKRAYGETIPSPWPNSQAVVTRQPVGVCAAITPWNFPAAMVTRKVAPAVAAGCTTVLKPAEQTPLTALALLRLAREAGIPPGVLNAVTGAPAPIGEALCASPTVAKLSFTGSTEVGKALMAKSAATVKRISLELGGNAPFIVFDDADLDLAVQGAVTSKFRNMGQTCICANRIYVQDGAYDAFVDKLAEQVRGLRVGVGTEAEVDQGPLIDTDAVGKVRAHVDDALGRGARAVVGGQAHARGGTFFEPTVLADVPQDARVTAEETFGPLAAVVRFSREDEVVRLANATRYGLASYFYTKDLGRAWRVSQNLAYGMVGVNCGFMTTEVAPFGGVKESGLGREGCHQGLDEYLETKYTLMAGLDG